MGILYDIFNKEKVSSSQINTYVKSVWSLWDKYQKLSHLKNAKLLRVELSRKDNDTLIDLEYRFKKHKYTLSLNYAYSRGMCSCVVLDNGVFVKKGSDSYNNVLKGYMYNVVRVCESISVLVSKILLVYSKDSSTVDIYLTRPSGVKLYTWTIFIKGNFESTDYKVTTHKVDKLPEL